MMFVRVKKSQTKPTIQKRNFTSLPEVPQSTKTTKLSNGVRVVSLEFARPTAAVGVFVNAGTRNEDTHTLGSAAFLKHLAFQNTKTKTAVRLVREFELIGATYSVTATREQLIYASQCRFENVNDILPLLTAATHPQLEIFQINNSMQHVEEHAALLKSDPRNYVLDTLHQRAFRQQGLGNSLYITPTNAHHVTVESISKFHKKFFVPENIAVVGVGGVKHDELVKLSEKLFVESAQKVSPSPSKYFGGEALEVLPTNKTYFGVAFQGLAVSDPLVPAALVLRSVLGEVSRAGREPIGNGASGILARNVLEDHPSLQHLEANSFSYSDNGLFGVYGIANEAKDHKYASHLSHLLRSLPSSLTDKHLALGKALARSQIAFNNSSTLTETLELIGTNVGATSENTNFAPSALVNAVENVSLSQLQQVAKQIFSSKPTTVAIGHLQDFPTLD